MRRKARPPRPIPLPTEPRDGHALPPSWHRAIYNAWKAGYTQREIRIAFGIGRATVERSLERSR